MQVPLYCCSTALHMHAESGAAGNLVGFLGYFWLMYSAVLDIFQRPPPSQNKTWLWKFNSSLRCPATKNVNHVHQCACPMSNDCVVTSWSRIAESNTNHWQSAGPQEPTHRDVGAAAVLEPSVKSSFCRHIQGTGRLQTIWVSCAAGQPSTIHFCMHCAALGARHTAADALSVEASGFGATGHMAGRGDWRS